MTPCLHQFSCCKFWLCLLFISGLLGSLAFAGPSREPTEYELKAAILYHFALFAEWPTSPSDKFNLCLYGPDPFGAAIEALTRRTLLDRPIQIQRPRQPGEISTCHLLYISPQALPDLPQLLTIARDQPILTIADQPQTTDASGSVIHLGLDRQKIIFDIDLAAANRAGLRLSSKLLRLAHHVR